jgi:hypothetical protein
MARGFRLPRLRVGLVFVLLESPLFVGLVFVLAKLLVQLQAKKWRWGGFF